MRLSLWRASRGVDGAWYMTLFTPNGFPLSPAWGPFDSEGEASEVCRVRNLFREKAEVSRGSSLRGSHDD